MYISLSAIWEILFNIQDNSSSVIIFFNFFVHWYSEEKFNADHYWGLKG